MNPSQRNIIAAHIVQWDPYFHAPQYILRFTSNIYNGLGVGKPSTCRAILAVDHETFRFTIQTAYPCNVARIARRAAQQ